MTAPTTMPSDPAFWESLHRLHGHRCPMSLLGARLALAAREALGPQPPAVHFSARYRHQTCALDGIQLATSCTPGNNNLEIDPVGEHHLTLWVQETGTTVCARLTDKALELGRAYGELRKRLRRLESRSAEACEVEAQMEQALQQLEAAPWPLLVELLAAPEPGSA